MVSPSPAARRAAGVGPQWVTSGHARQGRAPGSTGGSSRRYSQPYCSRAGRGCFHAMALAVQSAVERPFAAKRAADPGLPRTWSVAIRSVTPFGA